MFEWETEKQPTENKQYIVTVQQNGRYVVRKMAYPWSKPVVAWTDIPEPYNPENFTAVVENDLLKAMKESVSKQRKEYEDKHGL